MSMTSFDIPRFTATANFGDDFRASVFIAPNDVYIFVLLLQDRYLWIVFRFLKFNEKLWMRREGRDYSHEWKNYILRSNNSNHY